MESQGALWKSYRSQREVSRRGPEQKEGWCELDVAMVDGEKWSDWG